MAANPEQLRSRAFWSSRVFEQFEIVFWVGFIVLPMFTGWLAYDWLPNESFDERDHAALESHDIDDDAGIPHEIVDVWQDKQTGVIYSKADFFDHRRYEACRVAAVWFAYGLIGCFFFAFARNAKGRSSFYEAFGKATLVNLAIAAYEWIDNAVGR